MELVLEALSVAEGCIGRSILFTGNIWYSVHILPNQQYSLPSKSIKNLEPSVKLSIKLSDRDYECFSHKHSWL